MYYFLKADFDALSAEIEKIVDTIKALGQEGGKSCSEGAETFHDNFAHEDSQRQQYMWSTRLRELIHIRNQSRVFEPQIGDKVSLGTKVTVEDDATNEQRVMQIGSYMVFDNKEGLVISYDAPLAKMLIGGKVGDTREKNIAGKKKIVNILKIE